jgi:pseudaminic acid biosynthesis-associated methylase
MKTKQEQFWGGEFGKEYTDRNSRDSADWDKFYIENWGISKVDMNDRFLNVLPKDASILEVGCNTGMQLTGLQRSGFKNIYGVELQQYAVEKAKEYTNNVNIIQGSGFDIPFKDNFFDVVCTNGVLIHISPDNLPVIMREMVRCSKKYIWGWEYYAEQTTTINYRGNTDYLWKADYASLFMEYCPNLKLIKKELFPYVSQAESGNKDCMYLLEKV